MNLNSNKMYPRVIRDKAFWGRQNTEMSIANWYKSQEAVKWSIASPGHATAFGGVHEWKEDGSSRRRLTYFACKCAIHQTSKWNHSPPNARDLSLCLYFDSKTISWSWYISIYPHMCQWSPTNRNVPLGTDLACQPVNWNNFCLHRNFYATNANQSQNTPVYYTFIS